MEEQDPADGEATDTFELGNAAGEIERWGLDTVGNGGLHAVEKEEAAEQDENNSCRGSEKDEARRLAVPRDGPAEAVNDASHGIETVKPTPAFGDERRGVGNGRGKHPELDEKRDDIADVAVESIERGHP